MNNISQISNKIHKVFYSLSFNRSLVRTFSSSLKDINKKIYYKNKYDFNTQADKALNEYYNFTKIPRGHYVSIQDYLTSQDEYNYFHEQSLKHAFKN